MTDGAAAAAGWTAHPLTLEGPLVRLEPLSAGHVDALCRVGLDERIWEWNPFGVRTPEEMAAYVDEALALRGHGAAFPFATIERATGTVVGCTRFGAIDERNRRVEIGWTWLGPQWWRSGINTDAKRRMLAHAFEVWKCRRVEFKTDALNERSRAAIARLGAKFEGTLRHHMVTRTERMRDSVYYSILADEWTSVRSYLDGELARVRPA
ncbi:GNAT family N-acetyltransferase [bacterium]|nr:GNAT family N-acetyltransferase [bacterium]